MEVDIVEEVLDQTVLVSVSSEKSIVIGVSPLLTCVRSWWDNLEGTLQLWKGSGITDVLSG